MQKDIWRALPYSAESTDWQLAAGDAMIRALPIPSDDPDTLPPRPVLRWYTMTPRALILGSGQKLTEFDLENCRRLGIALHKRASGGTAVLAEPDQMMLDIALPRGHPLYRHDVTASYRWLGTVWQTALARLGINGTLIDVAEARADTQMLSNEPLVRRACYGGQSPYEVLVAGRKLVGLAQTRRRPGALLQTGIYVRWSAERLVQLFALPAAERAALAVRLDERMVGLAEFLPTESGELFAQVRRAFERSLWELYGVVSVHTRWTPDERAARVQALTRYAAIEY